MIINVVPADVPLLLGLENKTRKDAKGNAKGREKLSDGDVKTREVYALGREDS